MSLPRGGGAKRQDQAKAFSDVYACQWLQAKVTGAGCRASKKAAPGFAFCSWVQGGAIFPLHKPDQQLGERG